VAGYVMRQFTCPKAVTHPSTNRARCRATALIETNALPLHQTATICGSSVGPSSIVRHLGVWTDNGLTMSTHITKVVATGQLLRFATTTAQRTTVSVARVFYTTRGRPRAARLDCNGVLAGLPASQLSRLQSVLHVAARLIYGVRRYDHVTPLLQQLHWLSVPKRVTFKLCVMVYRCLHGIGPEYFSEDFRLVSEIYSRQ